MRKIRRIVDSGTAAQSWRTLVAYVRTGPTYDVRIRSALALRKVRTAEVKDALVKIASDKSAPLHARMSAVQGLKGHTSILTDEDIETILRSDEDMRAVFVDTLTDLASRANLSLEQVEAITGRYDRGKKKVRGNINVAIILFAGKHLKAHKGETFDRDIRPVLERFLVDCALKAGRKPSNLRPFIAQMMAENGIQGAVEVCIQCLKDDVEAYPRERKIRHGYVLKILKAQTGQDMGFDGKLDLSDPESLELLKTWLAWWDKNKQKPEYRLPTIEERPEEDDR